jgi:bifunctional DNA-binding transcriptional regulator/antitoxin component of YhaV-PrlF toxin-antitoxin module
MYEFMRSQVFRISEREFIIPEYLQVRSNGQITFPSPTRRKAKITEGDLLEAVVDANGTIRLVPKLALGGSLAEKYQLDDIAWSLKQKVKKA